MAGLAKKPLKVTWKFREPVGLSAHPIHLDALLAWASVKRAIDAGLPEFSGEDDASVNFFAAQEDLPLERTGTTWKASMLIFTPASELFMIPVTRKSPRVAFARDRNLKYAGTNKDDFSDGTGIYKLFDFRCPVQQMQHAVAWCIGDRDAIQSLLNDVLSVGPRHQKGLGRVASVTVVECPLGEEENWRIRVLPAESGLESDLVSYAPAYGRSFPPYWDRSQQELVAVPTVSPQI